MDARLIPSHEQSVFDKGIYACSRASVPERVAMWKNIRARGVLLTSSWIDDELSQDLENPGAFWEKVTVEIKASSRLILYIEPDDLPLRGAFVEVGIALGNGIPVTIVAPDVALDPKTCRPLGNWIKHPLVSFAATIEEAIEIVR